MTPLDCALVEILFTERLARHKIEVTHTEDGRIGVLVLAERPIDISEMAGMSCAVLDSRWGGTTIVGPTMTDDMEIRDVR